MECIGHSCHKLCVSTTLLHLQSRHCKHKRIQSTSFWSEYTTTCVSPPTRQQPNYAPAENDWGHTHHNSYRKEHSHSSVQECHTIARCDSRQTTDKWDNTWSTSHQPWGGRLNQLRIYTYVVRDGGMYDTRTAECLQKGHIESVLTYGAEGLVAHNTFEYPQIHTADSPAQSTENGHRLPKCNPPRPDPCCWKLTSET